MRSVVVGTSLLQTPFGPTRSIVVGTSLLQTPFGPTASGKSIDSVLGCCRFGLTCSLVGYTSSGKTRDSNGRFGLTRSVVDGTSLLQTPVRRTASGKSNDSVVGGSRGYLTRSVPRFGVMRSGSAGSSVGCSCFSAGASRDAGQAYAFRNASVHVVRSAWVIAAAVIWALGQVSLHFLPLIWNRRQSSTGFPVT